MRYFIITNDIQQGPFSIDELRARRIASDTLVWAEGMAQWAPAWQVPELRAVVYDYSPPPPPIVGEPSAAALHAEHPAAASSHAATCTTTPRKRGRLGCIVTAIIALGLLLFMAITNPSPAEHRQVIRQHLAGGMAKALGATTGSGLVAQGMGMLGEILAAPIVDQALGSLLHDHNYIVFSTTSITTAEGEITTSYGALGQVFTANDDQIAALVLSGFGSILPDALSGLGGWTTSPDAPEPSPGTSPSAPYDTDASTPADSQSLGRQIGHAVIDHVGQEVKKQVRQNTDSTTSNTIATIIDGVIGLIKGE